MYIVAGYFDVPPEHRDDFIVEKLELMQRSRAENGCLVYAFTADPIDPGRVLLFERWESKEALAEHLKAGRPETSIPVLANETRQYEIAKVGPVGS